MAENLDNVKKPIYATVGAGDVVVQAVADVVAQVRTRAENTSTDVSGRVEEARERIAAVPADIQEQVTALRERLAGLPSELPEDLAELREKFTVEELRRVAEAYLKVATDLYADLAERGESTVERLRTQPAVSDRIERAEGIYNEAVNRTTEALGLVSDRTRTAGDQAVKFANKVAGRAEETADAVAEEVEEAATEVKKTAKKAAAKATPAKKAPAKKAPAKKAPAKKA